LSEATVRVPATCGEYVQGMLERRHFLISCPIDLFAEVTVALADDGHVRAPADAPKAATALRLALRHLGAEGVGVRLRIASPIPRSKGLGSSTADVVGAIYALALALGCAVTVEEVACLALAVEPSNSSLFPNLALFDHRQGTIYEELGPPPPGEVLVLDCGGEVDTVAYNAVDRRLPLRQMAPTAAEALRLAREGIHRGDLALLGQGATLSALAHQAILPKPPLEAAIALGYGLGAAGVTVGHSGTVIGILFPPEPGNRLYLADIFRSRVPGLTVLGWHRLVGGGCRLASPAHAPCVR